MGRLHVWNATIEHSEFHRLNGILNGINLHERRPHMTDTESVKRRSAFGIALVCCCQVRRCPILQFFGGNWVSLDMDSCGELTGNVAWTSHEKNGRAARMFIQFVLATVCLLTFPPIFNILNPAVFDIFGGWDLYPLVMTNSLPWYRWPIEIDGLPINSMVDLSMANC